MNTSNELFSAGRWTRFLESLPLGVTDWKAATYKDILKIRATASAIAKNGDRAYSIKVSPNDDLKIYIEVYGKKKSKQTFQDKEL